MNARKMELVHEKAQTVGCQAPCFPTFLMTTRTTAIVRNLLYRESGAAAAGTLKKPHQAPMKRMNYGWLPFTEAERERRAAGESSTQSRSNIFPLVMRQHDATIRTSSGSNMNPPT